MYTMTGLEMKVYFKDTNFPSSSFGGIKMTHCPKMPPPRVGVLGICSISSNLTTLGLIALISAIVD